MRYVFLSRLRLLDAECSRFLTTTLLRDRRSEELDDDEELEEEEEDERDEELKERETDCLQYRYPILKWSFSFIATAL